jgi:hypothetical protein
MAWMHKLLVIALLVGYMSLAPGASALAATMVEYGGVVSQKQVGGSTNPKSGSVRNKQRSPKKAKAKR